MVFWTKTMSSFEFDPDKSAEENIDAFLLHVEGQSPELGKLLKANIGGMIPLPDGQKRAAARTAFNSAVKQALAAEPKKE